MEQLKTVQKSAMEEHFSALPEKLRDGSSYPLLLVVLGEKSAALTMNVKDEQVEAIRQLCDEFDPHLKVYEGRTSKPETSVGERPSFEQKGAFVARKEGRFEILEGSEGRFYGFSDKAVGKFLGFPESSIEFFDSHEQPGIISRREIHRMRDEGELPPDLEYLNLTTFIPAPEKEAVEKAIETGKRREKLLRELDQELEADIGEKYIKMRFNNNFY
jgi:hypothetical protein